MENIGKLGFLGSLYVSSLLLALTAGYLTLQGLDARQDEGRQMHAALQLKTMQWVETIEYHAIESESSHDEALYKTLEEQAETWDAQTASDQRHAQHDQFRAHTYKEAAQQEIRHAERLWKMLNESDQERLELMEEIRINQDREKELIHQLREEDVHQAACSWWGLRRVCSWLGGVTQLRSQADEIDVRIHREMERLADLDHEEYVQEIAAEVVANKSERFQSIAEDLRHVAQAWKERAQDDGKKAYELHKSASDMKKEVDDEHQQEHRYKDSILEMTDAMKNLMVKAQDSETKSEVFLNLSLACLVLPLIVFVWRFIANAFGFFEEMTVWTKTNMQKPRVLWRGLASCVLHSLVFATTLVWCRDYLHHLTLYNTETRTVIVFYFSFLAALTQSFWWQAVPHFLHERPWDYEAGTAAGMVGSIAQHFVLQTILLLPCFALELLIVWLSPLRDVLLNPSLQSAHRTQFLLFGFLLLYFYAFWFSPSQGSASNSSCQSTVTLDDDSESLLTTEITPLKTVHSPSATELFPQVYASEMAGHVQIRRNDASQDTSPYHVYVVDGLAKIYALMETFLLFCLVLILHLDLQSLLSTKSQWAYGMIVLGVLGSIPAALYAFLFLRCQTRGSDSTTADSPCSTFWFTTPSSSLLSSEENSSTISTHSSIGFSSASSTVMMMMMGAASWRA